MRLTVLHDGLGRDSRTIACLLAERRLLAVIARITGHPFTDPAVCLTCGQELP